MYLIRLIYASRAYENFSSQDIEQILGAARITNAKKGITGMLCFDGQHFLQSLEGSRSEVNRLYQKILDDKRHHDITLLGYQEIVSRDFDSWYMGYLGLNAKNKEILLRFSRQLEFDPFTMKGASAYALLRELTTRL